MSFNRKTQRARRHLRLRQHIKGTADRPRMAIYVSNKHMYVQFVDDSAMRTLAATSTLKGDAKCNLAAARSVGEQAATVARDNGISIVVVDRGGFKFHGRVKQIVDSAVEAGLKISARHEQITEEAK